MVLVSSVMRLKLITFDASNTLMRIRGSVGQHYAAVANNYYGATGQLFDEDRTEEAFVNAYNEINKLMPNFGYHNKIPSETWWYEVVHRVFFSLGLRDLGILRSISNQLYSDYCTKSNYELFPEVPYVLNALKSETDLKIGIISNFDERLEMLLEQLNIRNYFDMVLCSRSIGFAKPDRRIFEAALMLCGNNHNNHNIEAKEALHIGDSFKLDYIPAVEAGFNALLINRSDESRINNNYDLKVDVIDTLESLLPCQLKNAFSLKKAKTVGKRLRADLDN